MEEIIIGIIIIVVGLLALVIAVWLLKYLFLGAISLFEGAAQLGSIGVAVYFACWFFFWPFMLVVSIILGALNYHAG